MYIGLYLQENICACSWHSRLCIICSMRLRSRSRKQLTVLESHVALYYWKARAICVYMYVCVFACVSCPETVSYDICSHILRSYLQCLTERFNRQTSSKCIYCPYKEITSVLRVALNIKWPIFLILSAYFLLIRMFVFTYSQTAIVYKCVVFPRPPFLVEQIIIIPYHITLLQYRGGLC